MKFSSPKLCLCAVATFGLAMVATFTACGDSNTTEVIEQTGMDIVAKGSALPECGSENAGNMLYVADSAAVYYCADGEWAMLNGKDGADGEKGEKGETGAEGRVTNGASCTAEKKDDGSIDVSCDGKLVGTLENGKSAYELSGSELTLEKWLESLVGKTGESCTAKESKDEQGEAIGYDLICGTTEIGTIYNGTDGKSGIGCKIDDKGNGAVEVTCGKNGTPVTLYKAMCGSEGYDPKESGCCGQTVYSLENHVCDSRDSQLYKTVEICNKDNTKCQTWMAQNLNYNSNFKDAENKDVINSWCGGGVSETTTEGDCSVYGRLYLWSAAMDSAGIVDANGPGKGCGYRVDCNVSGIVQGACPKGLHLPSNAEWDLLRAAVGGANSAGKALKSASGWNSSGNGTDAYFFSALPAGDRGIYGIFYSVGNDAYFWSASQNGGYSAYNIRLNYGVSSTTLDYDDKNHGYSVRCIKD